MSNINKISDKEKLEYLNKILETDNKFRMKFLDHFNLQEKVQISDKEKDLQTLTEEIFELFNDVDLEMYMPDCRCNHGGYYDYYEDDISEELCDDLFLELVKKINNYIKNNDFYQALFILFAIGKAIELNPSVHDEYGLLYDYYEILSEHHYSLISKYVDKLQNINISPEDCKKFILFLIDNSDSLNELEKFEQLFIVLIPSKDMAQFVAPNILKFPINIQLKILNLLEDDVSYINTAKQFYKENNNIAQKLLKKLHEVSTYEEYEIVSKECFEKNNNHFVSDIFKVITYDKSKEFYLELLRYKVLNHNNLDEYILYKKYLNEKEIIALQDQLCSGWSSDYCIKVLEYEKRYDKILHLAQSEQNNNFKLLLTPIKFHFPKECYEIIINKCNKLMNSFGRNRNTYNEICDLLNIIIKVPTIKDDTVAYIKNNLVNTKPKLPALLDELKKAKLL